MRFRQVQFNSLLLTATFLLLGFLLGSEKAHEIDVIASTPTSLFNGKDLTGWYTFQRPPEPSSLVEGLQKLNGKYVEPIGLDKDPLQVFTVVEEDGEPAIRISGEVFGVLITNDEYENYHLSLEFKWGEKKYPPREDRKRDSGILYHSVGKEGARGGAWMRSVECQVQEGDVGDLWCVDSTTVQVRATLTENNNYKYDPNAIFRTFDMREKRFCQKSQSHENEHGTWNRLDIYTYDRESIHMINGYKNMHMEDIGQLIRGSIYPLTKGKIQIQSEGAEIFYRDITIRPIEEIPN